jgi:hypothetical protein
VAGGWFRKRARFLPCRETKIRGITIPSVARNTFRFNSLGQQLIDFIEPLPRLCTGRFRASPVRGPRAVIARRWAHLIVPWQSGLPVLRSLLSPDRAWQSIRQSLPEWLLIPRSACGALPRVSGGQDIRHPAFSRHPATCHLANDRHREIGDLRASAPASQSSALEQKIAQPASAANEP